MVYQFNAYEAKKARLAKAKRFWRAILVCFVALFMASMVSSLALVGIYDSQSSATWKWSSPEFLTTACLLLSVAGSLVSIVRHSYWVRKEREYNARVTSQK